MAWKIIKIKGVSQWPRGLRRRLSRDLVYPGYANLVFNSGLPIGMKGRSATRMSFASKRYRESASRYSDVARRRKRSQRRNAAGQNASGPHALLEQGAAYACGHASLEVDDLLTVAVAAVPKDFARRDGCVLPPLMAARRPRASGGHLHHVVTNEKSNPPWSRWSSWAP